MKKFVFLFATLFFTIPAFAADWKPVPGHIMTRWTKEVSPDKVLPEYPRPQMVRPQWQNLNGLWDYAVVDLAAPQPEKFSGKILVPFCIELALSGVRQPLTDKQRLWYHREFLGPGSGRRQTPLAALWRRRLGDQGAGQWQTRGPAQGWLRRLHL